MTISSIPLIGYADKLSARAGETIAFKVSSHGPEPYHASLVRIISGDPNPAGRGRKEEVVAADFEGAYPSRTQAVHKGSYVRVGDASALLGSESLTLSAYIWPTRSSMGPQAVISCHDGKDGITLGISPNGVTLCIGDEKISTCVPLFDKRWYRISASYDGASGKVSVAQEAMGANASPSRSAAQSGAFKTGAQLIPDAPLLIAAVGSQDITQHFNGKIDAPRIYDAALSIDQLDTEPPVAAWDFSEGISTTDVEDKGSAGLNGETINGPTRAVTGHNWDGSELCWRHAPDQYGAIYFHDDDLVDCGWETDFSFTIPDGMKSGVYGVRLTLGEHWETLPFFVCAPKGKPQSDLCVIISTFTYVVYHNQARAEFGTRWKERARAWGAVPWNGAEYDEFGLSTYNHHTDGSGISQASWMRPMFNVRPGYFPIPYDTGSGLRHFPADTHLFDWLEEKGFDFDVVTDWELHHDGIDAIKDYKTVTTGSHPEYHTEQTLDALGAYRDGGGKFVYLGGNGFYWRVALHQSIDGLIEIRRTEDGLRAWAAEPGEYYHAFDGAYGGLWRRQGRPPQLLSGVGFTSQGDFEGSFYRRQPGSYDPRAAWIFEGVEDEILGDFGLSGGGAAGYELDRADTNLGTPEDVIVLATSEQHQEHMVLVMEEILNHVATLPGEPAEDLIRSDMVYFELPGGGAVFSVGSITFCGSLSHNNYNNNISRIVENVLRRFLS